MQFSVRIVIKLILLSNKQNIKIWADSQPIKGIWRPLHDEKKLWFDTECQLKKLMGYLTLKRL